MVPRAGTNSHHTDPTKKMQTRCIILRRMTDLGVAFTQAVKRHQKFRRFPVVEGNTWERKRQKECVTVTFLAAPIRAELENVKGDERMWVIMVDFLEDEDRIGIRGIYQGARNRLEPFLIQICRQVYQDKGFLHFPQRFVNDLRSELSREDLKKVLHPLMRVRRYIRPFGKLDYYPDPEPGSYHYPLKTPLDFIVAVVLFAEKLFVGNDELVWKFAYDLLGSFLRPPFDTKKTRKLLPLLVQASETLPLPNEDEKLAAFRRRIYVPISRGAEGVSEIIHKDLERMRKARDSFSRVIYLDMTHCFYGGGNEYPSAFLETEAAGFDDCDPVFLPTCDAWALKQTIELCHRKFARVFQEEEPDRYLVLPRFPRGCHLFYKEDRDLHLIRYAFFCLDQYYEPKSRKRRSVCSAWPVVWKHLKTRSNDADFVYLSLRIIAKWVFSRVPPSPNWNLAIRCMQVLLTRIDGVMAGENPEDRWMSLVTMGSGDPIAALFRSIILADHRHHIFGKGGRIMKKLLAIVHRPERHFQMVQLQNEKWPEGPFDTVPIETAKISGLATLALYQFICDPEVLPLDSDLATILWHMDVFPVDTEPPKLPKRVRLEPREIAGDGDIRCAKGLALALALIERASFTKNEICRAFPSQLLYTDDDDPPVTGDLSYETSLAVCTRFLGEGDIAVVSFDGAESSLLSDMIKLYSEKFGPLKQVLASQEIISITSTLNRKKRKRTKKKKQPKKTPQKKRSRV